MQPQAMRSSELVVAAPPIESRADATRVCARVEDTMEALLQLIEAESVLLRAGKTIAAAALEPRKSDFAKAAEGQARGEAPKFDGHSEMLEIQVLGDWAFMRTRLSVTATPPDGSPPTRREGHTLTLLRKDGGRWKLARDANLLAPVA